jgi:hypothetical protein
VECLHQQSGGNFARNKRLFLFRTNEIRKNTQVATKTLVGTLPLGSVGDYRALYLSFNCGDFLLESLHTHTHKVMRVANWLKEVSDLRILLMKPKVASKAIPLFTHTIDTHTYTYTHTHTQREREREREGGHINLFSCDLTLCPSIPCPCVCTLSLSLQRAQLRQKVAELEARLVHVQQQHEQEISQLRAQTAMAQTQLFQQRYSAAQPQLTATVQGLQQVVLALSAQVAANTYTRSCMPPASAIDQFRHGTKLRQLSVGVVRRRDTDDGIDLFELACIGKKTGTLRLAEHACTFAVGQFVFFRALDKRLRLVQITSVSQPEAWGAICVDPVLTTQLVVMEGLYSPTSGG